MSDSSRRGANYSLKPGDPAYMRIAEALVIEYAEILAAEHFYPTCLATEVNSVTAWSACPWRPPTQTWRLTNPWA